ncbi:MAG: 1-(5-phosphoribosyl)-5-[(5-phosphoribosylamino)methylideneamino]imidazole-4-carboxamide isomerase [Chloroflexota bacterium]|nr:1-(5-phosphoribosyl)-5-[(5-phosphoribosylamino)methylideneamino]imidazole-4-carboxamide isomerase [Chloroflexota bacterium]
MIIYPAIDLRGGKVVRLREGDPKRQTIYSEDPLSTARFWQVRGATWLHMVNLDGALTEANDNSGILAQIAELEVKVQFGGGLRTASDIAAAFARGASRVVLGTAAVQNPTLVEAAIGRYGAEAVCVALDARNGFVTTHGWMQTTDLTAVELGRQMAAIGVRHVLFTDVAKDGGLEGVNRDATIALAQATGLSVIASGGVSSLDDVRALKDSGTVAGAVIGMALYEGKFDLRDALAIAGADNAG